MKVLVFLTVLTSLIFAGQTMAQNTAKVEVIRFIWSMYDRRKLVNESALFDVETANRPGRNTRMEQKTIEEQSQDLRKIESAAKTRAIAASRR